MFVCLHETLSLSQRWPWAIWSGGLCCGVWDTCQRRLCLLLQVTNQGAPWSRSGMETFRGCHACHFCFTTVCVLTLKCFHTHWLFVRMMTELILWAPGWLLFGGQWLWTCDHLYTLCFHYFSITVNHNRELTVRLLLGIYKVTEWGTFSSVIVKREAINFTCGARGECTGDMVNCFSAKDNTIQGLTHQMVINDFCIRQERCVCCLSNLS